MIKHQKTWHVLVLMALLVFFTTSYIGCEKDSLSDNENSNKDNDTIAYDPTPYELDIPPGFPEMPIPDENPMTEEGVKLGKMLYYDPILSTSGRSCNTCHMAEFSYASPRLGPGDLAVPPHLNLGWNPDFTWTGKENHLDRVAIIDLSIPDFIQPDMDSIKARLSRNEKYQKLFKQAYGADITAVNTQERKKLISYALAQFMRTMISGDSKYDRYQRGETTLTTSEKRGMNLFFSEQADCFHCHGTKLFTDNEFHNTGMDTVFKGNDQGRYQVTGDKEDMGAFSTPTLRNIELTAPYMHDNRFETLKEVVDFYSEGVENTQYTDPLMKYARQGGVQLSEEEKEHLIAFLKTLTDTSFVNDPAYQSPF